MYMSVYKEYRYLFTLSNVSREFVFIIMSICQCVLMSGHYSCYVYVCLFCGLHTNTHTLTHTLTYTLTRTLTHTYVLVKYTHLQYTSYILINIFLVIYIYILIYMYIMYIYNVYNIIYNVYRIYIYIYFLI